jgi:hypothetical protein
VRHDASALQAGVVPASMPPVQTPGCPGPNPVMAVPGQVPQIPVILDVQSQHSVRSKTEI